MKDPAFLFYSSDFLSGTMLMSDEEIGQYIKLLCLQHQKGHLKEKDMLNICKTHNEEIFSKFKKDEEGNYYNERLEYEANKRKAYSESRRNNRKKKETYEEDMKNICNSYEKHMENENINIKFYLRFGCKTDDDGNCITISRWHDVNSQVQALCTVNLTCEPA